MTDEKIIDEALKYYQDARWSFAKIISQKGYRPRHGWEPTKEEIKRATDIAKQVDALILSRQPAYLKKAA